MSLISEENRQIALWSIDYALEQGCDAARVYLVAGINNSFEFRNGTLETLESSTENSLQIELYIDQKYGAFVSNRLDKKELELFIKEGINSVKYLSEDKYRQLPNPERYYKENGVDLDIFDNTFFNISTSEKLNVAKLAGEEIQNTHPDIISITSNYDDSASSVFIYASNGFEAETHKTSFSLVVSVALKTDGDARSEAHWYDVAPHWAQLQKEGLGKIALEKALNKVGQEKIESGKYAMLLDNMTSTRLLSPIISAIHGSAIQQRNSFLIDKIGEKIFSDKITIMNKPHQKRVIGSRLFDGEGVATTDRMVIEDGILKIYYIDTYSSLKLGVDPTIGSSTGLCMKLGDKNREQLIQTIDKGIWVTGFNGGNTNPTTGDFSFGVDGFLIENGEVSKPISEMNITGNLLVLWSNVKDVGNDPRKNISTQVPSILFEDVNFSGL